MACSLGTCKALWGETPVNTGAGSGIRGSLTGTCTHGPLAHRPLTRPPEPRVSVSFPACSLRALPGSFSRASGRWTPPWPASLAALLHPSRERCPLPPGCPLQGAHRAPTGRYSCLQHPLTPNSWSTSHISPGDTPTCVRTCVSPLAWISAVASKPLSTPPRH